MDRRDIYDAIDVEYLHAVAKHPNWASLSMSRMFNVLVEEVGEAIHALNDFVERDITPGGVEDVALRRSIETELLQSAAVIVRMLHELKRRKFLCE